MDKRTFLRKAGLGLAGSLLTSNQLKSIVNSVKNIHPDILAGDEDFWQEVRGGYRLKPDYINLENGYYCFCPQFTLEAFIEHIREINYQGSYYMRTRQFDQKREIAARLSYILGCSEDELIITRNTTESLDTIISGIDWKKGDEAVMAEQDYGAMLNQFKLMSERYGMINKVISVPNHPTSDEEIVELYRQAITPKTRLLMVCHMINITGQILPVRKICDMAHSYGVEVLVDGAHAFAHIKYNVKDLDCDYYGASLHKWLSAPLGSGILYVKEEKIRSKWPVFAPWQSDDDDVFKFNHTGTHPVYNDLAILDAIQYYNIIGPERKEARLRHLRKYWQDKVNKIHGIILNTPFDENRSCGIANVGIKSLPPSKLAGILMDEYRIYTVAIDGSGVHGCRITPNIYTTQIELDLFTDALMEINKRYNK
jgi:selenocysteine lyase/cysteine desulfurase